MFNTVHKGDRSLIGNNSEFAPQEIMRPFPDRFYNGWSLLFNARLAQFTFV